MSTKISGNSGATLQFLFDNPDNKIVRKTCHGEKSKRLLKQAEKQKIFKQNIFGLKTPDITKIFHQDEVTLIEMPFIDGSDMISYTCYCDLSEFSQTTEKIIDFLTLEFQQASFHNFPLHVWHSKVVSLLSSEDVKSKISADLLFRCHEKLNNELPKEIPVGICHGDLTFSNMIIQEKDVYLIDFLDPPIETPYEDVSKLLIDCQYFWSLQKYSDDCDRNKVMIMWSHFAQKMLKKLQNHIDINTVKKFQLLGLLRMLPYTSDKKEVRLITNSMKDVIECC